MTQSKCVRAASAALSAGILSACAVDPPLTDERTTAQVEQAIASHPEMGQPNQIYVEAHDHTVYLTGTVYNDLVIADATDVAGKVPGVSRVVSNVAITQGD